jgi:hypothetical protein
MLDAMAERYGMLPSQVLQNASTRDLQIFDTAMSYRQYREEKAEKGADFYQQADLLAAVNNMRNTNDQG